MAPLKRILYICALTVAASIGWTSTAGAQAGISVHVPFVHVGLYSNPYVYSPWYGDYSQWGPYPYPYPYPFSYRDPGAAVRLEVKPKQTEVYVDGYYAGIVDEFDGTFQRLRVPPGEHEITLYLEGYRTTKQKVYLEPDNTFRIKYTMEHLGANEPAEPRPVPPPPPPDAMPPQGGAPPEFGEPPHPGEPPRAGQPRPMPPGQPYPMPPRSGQGAPRRPLPPPPPDAPSMPVPQGQNAGYGTLAIRVQPGDAEVLIDGQVWHSPATNDRLIVDVAEGRHAVDIRKSGYIGYVTEVQVRRGETTPLNVSLRTQDDR